jgi:hypothetical protein
VPLSFNVKMQMNLQEAVQSFDQWHYPWQFFDHVKNQLAGNAEEIAIAETIHEEANRQDHWMDADLVMGCKIAQNELRARFPDIDEHILALFVRAASYSYR